MNNLNLINHAYLQAVNVLKHCINKKGLYASGTKDGYLATWSRDLNIAMLGGSLSGLDFKKTFQQSLELLADNQPLSGQIPNCV
nr:hypothetical protein [bacterium]